jgi:hypothetical protein
MNFYFSMHHEWRRFWRRAVLAWIYLKAVATLWLTGRATIIECWTGRFHTRAASWRIVRALCFREPPVHEGCEPYPLDFMELEDVDIDNVEESVLRQIPDEWTTWKVELRCERGTQKRRLVMRQGEPIHVFSELRQSKPYRVLTASATFGEGPSLDLTDRVDKYVVVPHRQLYPRDLFPMDDQTDMPGTLFLRTVVGNRIIQRDYAFAQDIDLRASFASS